MWIQIYCTVLYCLPYCLVVSYMPPPHNNKYLCNLGLYWVLKLYKTKEIEIRIQIRKVYFRMVFKTKKTFEIYEISSIRIVNTLFSTDNIFYTQQRNLKTLIGGGGGTTIHPSTPTPSLLPVGCLRKRLLEFRESRNFIRKWSYFRDISSDFVYFRITFYTTFRIIWHDFHTKFRIPSNKNLTNNKCLWNLGLYWVLKLYKNKRNWNSYSDPKSIFSNGIRNKKNIRNIRNFEYTNRKHPI